METAAVARRGAIPEFADDGDAEHDFLRGAIQAISTGWLTRERREERSGEQAVSLARNAYSSTVIGFSVPLRGGWNPQAEAYRNNLIRR